MAMMQQITAKLSAVASAAVEFRQCEQCRRIIDHASDHAAGCSCRRTVLRRVKAGERGCGPTNADWCRAVVARLSAQGKRVEYRERAGWCWVEREM